MSENPTPADPLHVSHLPGAVSRCYKTVSPADLAGFAAPWGPPRPELLAMAVISAAQTALPVTTVQMSKTIEFTGARIAPGDTLQGAARVRQVRAEKAILIVDDICTNQRGETVARGETVLKAVTLEEKEKAGTDGSGLRLP
jgi:hypothetical protein